MIYIKKSAFCAFRPRNLDFLVLFLEIYSSIRMEGISSENPNKIDTLKEAVGGKKEQSLHSIKSQSQIKGNNKLGDKNYHAGHDGHTVIQPPLRKVESFIDCGGLTNGHI